MSYMSSVFCTPMINKYKINLLLFTILIFLLTQCQSDKNTPDISDIQVDISIRRFEKELFALDTNLVDVPFNVQAENLRQKYPQFMEVFTKLIEDRSSMDTAFENHLERFVKFQGAQIVYDTALTKFSDLSFLEQDLEEAFKYFKFYFPNRPIPEVVSYVSFFSTGTFTYGDSLLGIGLDFFFGKTFPYQYDIFPGYIQRTMDKPYLVSKAVEAVASNVAGQVYGNRLIDYMVANGKMLYVKSLLLPNAPDSILLEWTSQHIAWMEDPNNERELWTQIAKRDLLYSTRRTEFDKLIVPSPMGATWMPKESPGKTGNWIGWQIVKAYMKNNPTVTIEQLIRIEDAQLILDKSQYRPKR